MAKKDSFLLRTDPAMLEALRRWANDELRSANGQLEFILRRALAEAGRLKLIAGGVVDAPGEVPDD
ncbi:MAG: hypothetical protein LBG44_01180 [Gemmatimonadota bacterium]|nr:hypothetical protein [Gemmatimonadota bacterium]